MPGPSDFVGRVEPVLSAMWRVALVSELMIRALGNHAHDRTDADMRAAVDTWLYLPTSMAHDGLGYFGGIRVWNTSAVTDMSRLFFQKTQDNLRYNGDELASWDVSRVTTMESMFAFSVFNGNLAAWDVASLATTEGMFEGATLFNGDLGAWGISALTTMAFMFRDASSFDHDLGWCMRFQDGVNIDAAFEGTACAARSCGVRRASWCPQPCGNIEAAIDLWLADEAAARAAYGPPTAWDVSCYRMSGRTHGVFDFPIIRWWPEKVIPVCGGLDLFVGALNDWFAASSIVVNGNVAVAVQYEKDDDGAHSAATWDTFIVTSERTRQAWMETFLRALEACDRASAAAVAQTSTLARKKKRKTRGVSLDTTIAIAVVTAVLGALVATLVVTASVAPKASPTAIPPETKTAEA